LPCEQVAAHGPPYLAWSFALILFGLADVVAYALTV
jgi:hypothetical protein